MSIANLLLDAEQRGSRDAETFLRDPSAARHLELGAFSANTRPGILLLRRVLLLLRVPPRMLAWARTVLRGAKPVSPGSFLRAYSYWRGVRRAIRDRATWRRVSRAPVILMYHAIGGSGEQSSCYVVPERRFRLQMTWLRVCRYHVMSLSDLVDHLRSMRLPPARAVVVTFDDGYQDNYRLAFPVLRGLRIPATIFLVADGLGQSAAWTTEPALAGRPLLMHGQVREMVAAGIEVGAHTRTHPSLPAVSAEEDRERETTGSREVLERSLGCPVRVFAYPFGNYDSDVVEAVRRGGFSAACCSRSGPNDPVTPLFELRRVEIRGTDSLIQFALMVWSGRRLPRRTPIRGVTRSPAQARWPEQPTT